MTTLGKVMDIDDRTIAYIAGRAKEIAIAKMYQDKDAAQNGRR